MNSLTTTMQTALIGNVSVSEAARQAIRAKYPTYQVAQSYAFRDLDLPDQARALAEQILAGGLDVGTCDLYFRTLSRTDADAKLTELENKHAGCLDSIKFARNAVGLSYREQASAFESAAKSALLILNLDQEIEKAKYNRAQFHKIVALCSISFCEITHPVKNPNE